MSPIDYFRLAMKIHDSLYAREEKVRHYKEILAQMRSRFTDSRGDPEFIAMYNWIVSLISQS